MDDKFGLAFVTPYRSLPKILKGSPLLGQSKAPLSEGKRWMLSAKKKGASVARQKTFFGEKRGPIFCRLLLVAIAPL